MDDNMLLILKNGRAIEITTEIADSLITHLAKGTRTNVTYASEKYGKFLYVELSDVSTISRENMLIKN